MTRAYYLRPMPRKLAHKYFCSASVEPGIPCCKLASFYLVARPLRGRPSLYRRCEECARRNAKELRIVFEEVKG